jgi:hypothetical protein
LGSRSGIARGELDDVRLIAWRARIRIAHERVKFRGAQIVASLRIFAPTVRGDVRAGRNRVARQFLEAAGRLIAAEAIENALRNDVRAGGNTESVDVSQLIGFAKCAVPRDDARAMRAVAVLVRRIGQLAIIEEGGHAPREVRVHSRSVAGVQPAVGHRDGHVRAGVTKIMDVARAFAAKTGDDVGRNLVEQLHLRGWLDPKYAVGLRELLELPGREPPAQDCSESAARLLLEFSKCALRPSDLGRVCTAAKQNAHLGSRTSLRHALMHLVLGTVSPHPMHEGKTPHLSRRYISQAGDKRVLRHVMQQLDSKIGEVPSRLRVGRPGKLNEKKPLLGRGVSALGGDLARCLDGLVSQLNGLGCERKRTQTERDYKKRVQPPSGLHSYIIMALGALGKSSGRVYGGRAQSKAGSRRPWRRPGSASVVLF